MDRYPVADLDSPTIDPVTGAAITDPSRGTAGVGFGIADGIAIGSEDLANLGDTLDLLFEGEEEEEDPESAEDRALDRDADLMRRSRDVILTEEVDGELDDFEIRKRLGLLPGQNPFTRATDKKRSMADRDGRVRRTRDDGENGSEDDDDEYIDLDVEEAELESLIEEITEGKGVSHRKNADGKGKGDNLLSETVHAEGDDEEKEFSMLEDEDE
jgi:hypothetical protein